MIDGIAVVQATGELTGCRSSTTFVSDIPAGTVDGEIAVAVSVKVAEAVDVSVAVTDEFDLFDSENAPGVYVVFEFVTLASSGQVVAIHADLDYAAQTFLVPPRNEETPPVLDEPPATVRTPTAVAGSPCSPPASCCWRLATDVSGRLARAGEVRQ